MHIKHLNNVTFAVIKISEIILWENKYNPDCTQLLVKLLLLSEQIVRILYIDLYTVYKSIYSVSIGDV